MRLLLLLLLLPGALRAAELHVLTAGAYRATLMALAPAIEAATGDTLKVENETAGGVARRVAAGELADLVVLPPSIAAELGDRLGPAQPLAKVGIGAAVRDGAPVPDIGTEAGFRTAVLLARAPAWIDPAAGGSSGIYLSRLFERWGIAAELAPRAVLVNGGLVADRLLDGTADLALQQMSELATVPGVHLIGALPPAIQSWTTYAGAVPTASTHQQAAQAVLARLAAAEPAVLLAHGMERP